MNVKLMLLVLVVSSSAFAASNVKKETIVNREPSAAIGVGKIAELSENAVTRIEDTKYE